MEYTIAKGVFDILPFENQEDDKWRESNRWQYLEKILRETAHDYGFKELRTPLFERTELFVRSVGKRPISSLKKCIPFAIELTVL